MSIYSTWWLTSINDHEETCGKWLKGLDGHANVWQIDPNRDCTCYAGPLIYRGSHVNPDADGKRGGLVEVGAIPNHCHPAVRGSLSDDGPPVEFLRLAVEEDPQTYGGNLPGQACVILDREQVQALYDTLKTWLEADERS